MVKSKAFKLKDEMGSNRLSQAPRIVCAVRGSVGSPHLYFPSCQEISIRDKRNKDHMNFENVSENIVEACI